MTEPVTGSTYTIDGGDESARPVRLRQLDAALDWVDGAAPDDLVHAVDWLQNTTVPTIAAVGSAAIAWLSHQQAPEAILRAQMQHGLRALVCNAADLRVLQPCCPPTLALATTEQPLADVLLELREQMLHASAPSVVVYGVLADVFGLGVLIVGPAGVGKSELALELLTRGHRLVADDAVDVQRLPGGLLIGSAPQLLEGFLEVRGLGVLDVARMFGDQALARRRRVDFLLELRPVREAPLDYRARLAGLRGTVTMLGQTLPTICLPIRVGHNLATLVEAASRDQWLRLRGHHADETFAERQQQAIDAQGEDNAHG